MVVIASIGLISRGSLYRAAEAGVEAQHDFRKPSRALSMAMR